MADLILGEELRTLDDRGRLSLPAELLDRLLGGRRDAVLAKERAGCLSLWSPENWEARVDEGVRLVRDKIEAGRLAGRIDQVQRLGRLLSTRNVEVRIAGRSRIAIPEGFREFLGVPPGGGVAVVGAAICLEIWRPEAWQEYVATNIPEFRKLVEDLVG